MKIKLFNLQYFNEGDEGEEGQVDTPVETPDSNVDAPDVDSQATESDEATPDYSDFLTAVNGKAVYKGEATTYETFDDVITDAQKGKNYDPVHERMSSAEARVQELENSPQSEYFTAFYKDQGFETFADYKLAVDVNVLVQEGMSEERAIEHVKGQRALNTTNKAKAKAEQEANKENLTSKNSAEAIDWYKDNGYGDLTADKIDQKTWDAVNNDGVPLKYALAAQMLQTVKSDVQQDTLKKLQNKQDTSMGSITSSGDKQVKSVNDMTDAEFEAFSNDRAALASRYKR